MKTKLYATALTATLLVGAAGFAIAQGTPPATDPTAGTAEPPAAKKNVQKAAPQPQTTGTATEGSQTSPPTPAPK